MFYGFNNFNEYMQHFTFHRYLKIRTIITYTYFKYNAGKVLG